MAQAHATFIAVCRKLCELHPQSLPKLKRRKLSTANSAQVSPVLLSPPRGATIAVFAGTLFFSALLMFVLQPMFAKMALPRLGGSAAVWSLALVFFQGVLLCGYGYAHFLAKFAGVRAAGFIHGAVMLAAAVSLPIAIAPGWDIPPESGEAFWVLGLFAASVGLPFFAISANAPLLQSWFARLGHAQSHDPYFLYAASNVGSFVALLAYPFLIEPFLGLTPQSTVWTVGFAVLFFLLAACGVMAASAGTAADEMPAHDQAPTWGQRLKWIALSFVPSGLLVGTTAHITTDLVSAPFMWVVPLALYLLTFVITFQRRPWLSHEFVISRMIVVAAPLCIVVVLPFTDLFFLPIHLIAIFTLMMACHGELVRLRPVPRRLTEFYFLMSLGGVLGGIFASLAAPFMFSRVLEYPLLIVAAFVIVGISRSLWTVKNWQPWLAAGIAPGAIIFLLALGGVDPAVMRYSLALWLLASIAGIVMARKHLFAQALFLLSIILVYPYVSVEQLAIARERSLYGVSTVYAVENGRFHIMSHGTTEHGSQQWTDSDGARLTTRPEPTSYYYSNGPIGNAIRTVRSRQGQLGEVAVVGLGAGAIACLAMPDESWSYFEIDPVVVKIARDAELFTLLRDCQFNGKIVMGDGRLQLQREPDSKYDLIILDAFSSDSIPAHLLTIEAFEMYFEKLGPDGVLIFHISNKFMDLAAPVDGAAKATGLVAYINILDAKIWKPNAARHEIMPQVVVIGKSLQAVDGFREAAGWQPLRSTSAPKAWTDDYADVLGAIWRKSFGKSSQ